jgi:hypothetical protein
MISLQSFSTTNVSPAGSRKPSRSSIDLLNSKIKFLVKDNSHDFEIFEFFTKLKSSHFSIPATLLELERNEIFFLSSPNGTLQTYSKK